MAFNVTDANGATIDIGTMVEYEQYWKRDPDKKIGVVKEVVFKHCSEPSLKIAGAMNRSVPANEVEVLVLTNAEKRLLDVFAEHGMAPDIDMVRDIIEAMKGEM